MQQFDLVIIGGGIAGVFAAYHGRKQGLKVALFEAGKEANCASVRNFGQIVASGQSLGAWRNFGIRSIELYQEVAKLTDLPVKQEGSLYLASNAQEQQLLEELAELDQQDGYHSQLLSASQVLARIPVLSAAYVKRGLSYSNELTSDSPNLLPVVVNLLRKDADFRYFNSSKVVAVDTSASGHRIASRSGLQVSARQVLVCCGHRLDGLFAGELMNSDMQISRLQMLSTPADVGLTIPGNLLTGLTIRRYGAFKSCPSFSLLQLPEELQALVDAGIHLLFSQRPDGSIVIGDSHDYYSVDELDSLPFAVNMEINELILNEAGRILNGPPLPISRVWNGYYSEHIENPIVARSIGDGIHLLTGFGGKGMSTAPGVTEKAINRIIAGDSIDTLD